MGFAGYVSICMQLYCVSCQNKQTTKKKQADKHTRKETTKITEKTRMETRRV
jgi:hypothetical protein